MFNHCIYFNLNTLSRQIGKIWQAEFEKIGLSTSHAYLLYAIVHDPTLTQANLGEIFELNASTVTRFVEDLTRKNLLKKTGKGKGSKIEATLLGKKECRKIEKIMDALFNQMQKKLGKSKFSSFVDGIYKIRESLFEWKK
jgi:DNA-binding MarR family transcriptional regulator